MGVGEMSLKDQINNILKEDMTSVRSMLSAVEQALMERGTFEREKCPNGSHIEFRRVANFMSGNRYFAAFLVAVNADPNEMLNRVRKNGSRANLKGIHKVRKLYEYIMGKTNAFERVSLALFASTIIAALKGINWISSQEQELILSSERIRSLPRDVQEAIREYQHKHMTLEGDSRNQSCQFRTTFANLGIYQFAREDFDDSAYTLGINVNLDSPIVKELSSRWELGRYMQ